MNPLGGASGRTDGARTVCWWNAGHRRSSLDEMFGSTRTTSMRTSGSVSQLLKIGNGNRERGSSFVTSMHPGADPAHVRLCPSTQLVEIGHH